jgi:hypothetical protein
MSRPGKPHDTLPTWLPPPVRSHVAQLEKLLAGPESLAILRRLSSDPRMIHVWRYLTTRQEATDKVLIEFFDCAFWRAVFPDSVTTAEDRAARAAPWFSVAASLRGLNNFLIATRLYPELAPVPVFVAEWLEGMARLAGNTESPLVVKHHSGGDESGRAYVLVLGNLTRKLFGSPLRGTVARTSSVALQKEIDGQQVRDWLRP